MSTDYRAARGSVYASALEPRDRLVLLALIEHLPVCAPSVQRIMRMTGMSKAGVLRVIKSLELEGILTVTREDGRRSHYRLNLSQCDTGISVTPVSGCDHTGISVTPPPVSGCDPKQTSKADKEADPPKPPRGQLGTRFDSLRWSFPSDPTTAKVESGMADLAECREHFLDWARGTTRRYVDWTATYRNAVRRWKRERSRQAAPGSRFIEQAPVGAGWAPDASNRAWPPFARGLLAFEATENGFRRSPEFQACKTAAELDAAWKAWVKSRAAERMAS